MGRPRNVGRRRKWFRDRRSGVAGSSGTDEVEYQPLLDREFLQITRISVEDKDNGADRIRVSVRGHGYDHPELEQVTAVAGSLYWGGRTTYLVAGESIVAIFTAPTDGDNLALYIEGWIWDYPPPLLEEALAVAGENED